MFKIKDINLVLELENGILPLKFKDKTITAGYEQYIFLHEDRGVNAAVYITKEDNICTGSISVKINNHPILENFNLTEKMPIKISITFDEIPVSLCAAYMCRDWWSRPAFIKSFKEIPEKTQALFLEGKNSYGFLMPMVGEKMKAFISGEASNSILFELTAYTAGISNVNDVFFISSEG